MAGMVVEGLLFKGSGGNSGAVCGQLELAVAVSFAIDPRGVGRRGWSRFVSGAAGHGVPHSRWNRERLRVWFLVARLA
jgi:hypothetical protein